MAALGINWRSSSIRLPAAIMPNIVTPVRLPPGRLRLATRPAATGRDGNLGDLVMRPGPDVNPAPLGGELQGVGQEVQEHLLHLPLVAPNRPQPFIYRVPERDPPPNDTSWRKLGRAPIRWVTGRPWPAC